ncbi:MAG TPA: tetratricopeptide repeat protein [Anaeromyxobacteraceae bacterium]|nr:tetratricopeptide repeat protein [Anaeromyxobacteraceae bacterium]
MSPALLAALLLLGAGPVPPEAQKLKEEGDRRRAAADAEGAREAYQAAVAAFGGYAEAREALGEVLLAARRFSEAAREFEQAAGIEPGLAVAWYNLGYASRRAGDLARARDAWRRYLALRPEDRDAWLGLAEVLRGLGEREAALEAYQTFVVLALRVPDEAARVEKARLAMAALGEPSPSGSGQTDSMDTTRGEGVRPSATPVIVVPVPALPAPAPAEAPPSGRPAAALQKLRLGDRLLAEGDTRLALFAYQDAVNHDPRSAAARLKLGRLYAKLDHLPEAVEQFSVAAALDPSDPEVKRALEEARARLEGRPPPASSPIIVRLPPGASLEPPAETPLPPGRPSGPPAGSVATPAPASAPAPGVP